MSKSGETDAKCSIASKIALNLLGWVVCISSTKRARDAGRIRYRRSCGGHHGWRGWPAGLAGDALRANAAVSASVRRDLSS
jgi:hypothetical protein